MTSPKLPRRNRGAWGLWVARGAVLDYDVLLPNLANVFLRPD
jgi:hypothetical protein